MHDRTIKLIFREMTILLFLQVVVFSQSVVASATNVSRAAESSPELSSKKLIEKSQISYRAEGGFSGVQSYGVIISCVKGKVSVMRSIYDPRLPDKQARVRQLTAMDQKSYLKLWRDLERHSVLQTRDCSMPKGDITDEFTVDFFATVGSRYHKFRVYGIGRPEAARYFVLRKIIDDHVQMGTLWDIHRSLARHLGEPELSRDRVDADPAF